MYPHDISPHNPVALRQRTAPDNLHVQFPKVTVPLKVQFVPGRTARFRLGALKIGFSFASY